MPAPIPVIIDEFLESMPAMINAARAYWRTRQLALSDSIFSPNPKVGLLQSLEFRAIVSGYRSDPAFLPVKACLMCGMLGRHRPLKNGCHACDRCIASIPALQAYVIDP